MEDGIPCAMCGGLIEDGQTVVDGNHGEAVTREGEDLWTGEIEFNSKITTVHYNCFEKAIDEFEEEVNKDE